MNLFSFIFFKRIESDVTTPFYVIAWCTIKFTTTDSSQAYDRSQHIRTCFHTDNLACLFKMIYFDK